MALWKVACLENEYPGMWQRWYRQQCVGIGWGPDDGFKLDGPTQGGAGWSRAREALKIVAIGDHVVVALRNNRVGRLGQVTGKAIADSEWDPLVPQSRDLPHGEMGRRILVRWDLMVGPDGLDTVIALPTGMRFTSGELRPTISNIRSRTLLELRDVMNDQANWVGLQTQFKYEQALSDYIAVYPQRLEDGLTPHPNDKIRERVFVDRSRLDVLLIDRNDIPVIVECKQYAPTIADLTQIRNYMQRLQRETNGVMPRGILVHGGSRKLRADVAEASNLEPKIELVQYRLDVAFVSSS